MGQRMENPEYEFGNDCNIGEGLAAPLWLDGETPRYVYMRFSLIELCNIPACVGKPIPPNDRVFRLEQNALDPCIWEYDIDFYVFWRLYNAPPPHCEFEIFHRPSFKLYFGDVFNANDRDPRFGTNVRNCGELNTCGFNGIACVRWGPEAETILNGLNMEYEYSLFMELWPIPDGKIVYKFCRLQDATNVKILFDPTI